MHDARPEALDVLIRALRARLPERWDLDGDALIDAHGNPILELTRYLGQVPGHEDGEAFRAQAAAALQAMAYGPDVMLCALQLVAALYAAEAERVAGLADELLELISYGFGIERERLHAAVWPARPLPVEEHRGAPTRQAALNGPGAPARV
jgi:hypothetical protein